MAPEQLQEQFELSASKKASVDRGFPLKKAAKSVVQAAPASCLYSSLQPASCPRLLSKVPVAMIAWPSHS